MAKEYSKEELWRLYEKLPQELQEAVFSQETADHIFSACERHDVNEVSKVAYHVGLVLMGILTPQEFEKTLVQEVKLKKSAAKEVAREINRFVFYPVKPQLELLHRAPGEEAKTEVGIPTPRHSDRLEPQGEVVEDESLKKTAITEPEEQEEPKKEKGPDLYRESL